MMVMVGCTFRLRSSRLGRKILSIILPRTFSPLLPLVTPLTFSMVWKGNQGRAAVRLLLRLVVSRSLDPLDAGPFYQGTSFPNVGLALCES